MIKTLLCPKCQRDVEIVLSESGPHIKASCFDCGGYIKFMSHSELTGEKEMSEYEITVDIEGSQYNEVIIINKYHDTYSLALGGKSKDGNVYFKWVFPQGKDRQPMEKAIPLKIPLGNRTDAVETIRKIAIAFGLSIEGDGGAF